MLRADPTEKQAEVIRFMVDHLREYQRYPSVSEMAHELRVHPNAVADRLRLLERKGWIERPGQGSAGGYVIPGLHIAAVLPDATHWMRPQVSASDAA